LDAEQDAGGENNTRQDRNGKNFLTGRKNMKEPARSKGKAGTAWVGNSGQGSLRRGCRRLYAKSGKE